MITNISRRGLLRTTVGAAGFLGLRNSLENRLYAQSEVGFGPLIPDPEGLLDLPRGFKYRAFSRTGELMEDGYRVPGLHDGMAAYPGPNGTTILIRNHEMQVANPGAEGSPYPSAQSFASTDRSLVYDGGSTAPASGSTTNLVFNTRLLQPERHFLSLTGTIRNCAGGPMPWGSWLTCEETGVVAGDRNGNSVLAQNHGWVFEVLATDQPGIQRPVPLTALGRFSHEAVAMDPNTGILYLTEDQGNSVFYRFVPDNRGNIQASNLQSGRLQALKYKVGNIPDTRNRNGQVVQQGVSFEVEWVDLVDTDSPRNDLRLQAADRGAAIFSREEGCWWGNNAIYFVCTDGGLAQLGQIFKYTPSPAEGTPEEATNPGRIELFIEPSNSSQFAAPDNICVAPSGDIIVCEDGSGDEFVHGVTANATVYKIARNAFNGSEFAGSCFSPDGSTLFVNMQTPGISFAIKGPWQRRVG